MTIPLSTEQQSFTEESITLLKDLLIQRSTPYIYRLNSFRLLDLSSFSTMREINKRRQIIEIHQNNGVSIPKGLGINLIPANSDRDLKFIIEQLQNPISRLLEEFFWFWPENYKKTTVEDLGFQYLKDGDTNNASLHWNIKTKNDDKDGVFQHNLAVLSHLQLLEFELKLMNSENRYPDNDIGSKWKTCFQNWDNLLCHEGFWSFITSRVRELDDPRLTTGNVKRLRDFLPLCLVLVQIRLALKFAEGGHYREALKVTGFLQNTSFDIEVLDEGAEISIDPVIKRLNYLCDSALEGLNTNQIEAHHEISDFIIEGTKMLEVVDIVKKIIPINDHWDCFAKTALDITLDYGYKTENDKESIRLLNGIKTITNNVVIKDVIEHHIKYYSERISKGNYWCAEGYFSLPKQLFDALEKARKAVRRKKYQEAKTILESLLTQTTNPLSKNQIKIVNTSLAHCLNFEAVEFLNQADDLLQKVPGFVIKVSKRYSYAKERINLAGWAAENYKLSQACYEGLLFCMACGKYIDHTSDIGTFKFDKAIYIGCSSCIREYNIEFEANKKKFLTKLKTSINLLARANKLNPNNKQIIENFDFIIPIAKNWGISTNEYSLIKSKKEQPIRIPSTTQTSNKTESSSYSSPKKTPTTQLKQNQLKNSKKNNNTILWIALGISLIFFICVLILTVI